ncbi:carboxypeptidase-like regulatory domain-containing protein [Chitinophaga nivalis]|uniref:Carboxypeptidase-like regulatory domain-containing protein n=1 Tax=Chitinophaga nivalis TaxID=2991709 RepID=A0ABT3IKG6_9BACT|nr:carboxypeptidase-like regulatory domain-containing protein [Chitinophaga nivalis]MCW3466055.1 carboxypeptidase-like regulatory domain-containing protein [Chitinophaga nivalis]MCW3484254.1 carboxypeptidase-like regulatory domain-containing protein [Chitinophaga nivalis]
MRKQTPFTLKIASPCQQSWHDMRETTSGRYCSHCSKNVIDFTTMSDAEIEQLLQDNTQQYCGYFKATQINNTWGTADKHKPRTVLPAAMVSALLLAAVGNSEARPPAPLVTTVHNFPVNLPVEASFADTSAPGKDSLPEVSGVVRDKDSHDPLVGVVIEIKGTTYRAITDVKGRFTLKIPAEVDARKIKLIFLYIGYESKELKVKGPYPMQVTLELSQTVMGQFAIVRKKTGFLADLRSLLGIG